VQVAGLTVAEAEAALQAHLQKILRNPKAQVTLVGLPLWPAESQGFGIRYRPPTQTASPAAASAKPSELAALREHATFLEERFKSIDANNRAGSPGGSQDDRDMTGYEMAAAQAELALATGRRDEAAAHCREAEKFAENALRAAKANYEAGRITNDMVLQAANNLAESRRRTVRIRDSKAFDSGQPSRGGVDDGRATHESVRSAAGGNSTLSIGVVKKLVEGRKRNYERVQDLARKNLISASELERVKNEYEAELARMEQAQRALKYYQLQVEFAETEFQEAAEKNKAGAGAVTEFELRKLRLKVELAKAKLSELAE
jgi:hypothetical protein